MSDVKSDVKEVAAADPVLLAHHRASESTSHRLMEECHVKPTSTHAAEWWKKAHANAIQAMPEEIKCHDSVKGQVGTTLWDVAHASLESGGQKGSVKHEMKRLAEINHISVDCNDLRGKEIHLHAPKPADCPPQEAHHKPVTEYVPLPPHRPQELAPPVPLPPHRPLELHPHRMHEAVQPAPEPPCKPEDRPREPHVIAAPDYVERGRPLPPPPREDWDRREMPPVERLPNPLKIIGDIGQGIFGAIGAIGGRDSRFGGPPPPDFYGAPGRQYDNGYDNGVGAGLGLNFNLGLSGGFMGGGERYPHRENYNTYERANSFPIGRPTYQEAIPQRTHMQRYSGAVTTPEYDPNCPPGMMRNHSRR